MGVLIVLMGSPRQEESAVVAKPDLGLAFCSCIGELFAVTADASISGEQGVEAVPVAVSPRLRLLEARESDSDLELDWLLFELFESNWDWGWCSN